MALARQLLFGLLLCAALAALAKSVELNRLEASGDLPGLSQDVLDTSGEELDSLEDEDGKELSPSIIVLDEPGDSPMDGALGEVLLTDPLEEEVMTKGHPKLQIELASSETPSSPYVEGLGGSMARGDGPVDDQGGARVTVGRFSPHCRTVDKTLTCDFRNTKEEVWMTELDVSVAKVFLHNAVVVHVGARVCARLSVHQVDNLVFERDHECPPDTKFGLKLVSSKTNYIPCHVTRLDMLDSSAGVAECQHELTSLSVVRSSVSVLNVAAAVRSGATVRLEHATIGSLVQLALEKRTELLMVNTTVGTMGRGSISLADSAATIRSSTFRQSHDQALVLGPGARASLRDVEGMVTLAGPPPAPLPPPPPKPAERSPPMVPPKNLQRPKSDPLCPQPSSLLWLLPSALALVEAGIILLNCTGWFPQLKGRRKPGLEEGAGGMADMSYSTNSYYYGGGETQPNLRHRFDKAI